jgi:zinc finger protein
MNCEEQGETKFMYTKIPFFKEVMISAFCCDHCGTKNSEITFAGKLEDYGVKYEVNVINDVAFNRQVVKSEFATIKVPECGLEMPPATQKGSIKTIEGYFASTIEGLQAMQEERRTVDPATAKKIDEYCQTLKEYSEGKRYPFKFIVEDPSGNSYVQNPSAPTADQYCKKTNWIRTIEDYTAMGYPADQATI